MKLREYQQALSLDARRALARNNSIILQLTTGGGKTRIATDFVERASGRGVTTAFLADREEILEQTVKHFTALGIECQVITAKTKVIYKSKVYVGMVESFFRRFSKGLFNGIDIGLFIFDEAHVGNYYKLIKELKNDPWIIGLTATPVASSKNNPLKNYYKDIVCGPSTRWLIDNGFLVPSIDIGSDKLLDLKTLAGEFSSESQMSEFKLNNVNDKMFMLWKKHASSRQTIVYNINIDHNNEVFEMFDSMGYDVAAVSSETPEDERKEKLKLYEKGDIQILCNVGILTKGYDSPETSCIVANFSTQSLSKWYQVTGRGGRPCEGKNNFITIDMGNNLLLHGSYNDSIDWSKIFEDETRDRNFKIKLNPKLCNVCYAYLFNIHVPECHVCGNKINVKELIKLERLIPDEIKDKSPDDMTLNELQMYAKYKGYKAGYAWTLHMKNIARRKKK